MHQEEPSVEASFQGQCTLSNATPAYQVAVNSGDTEKAKFLQTFIEDHFEQLWTHHRDALLKLSLPALVSVLSADRLNIQAEATVWFAIENWIKARHAERLEHLPLLFKKCLRIGRLRQLFIQHILLRSSVYLDLSAEAHEEVKQHVAQVFGLLNGAHSQEAIIDGRGLLYHKTIVHFRPRDTRYLLIAAHGKKNTVNESIDVYDEQLNMWRPTCELELPPQAGPHRVMHFLDGLFYIFNGSPEYGPLLALDITQTAPTWREICPMLEKRAYPAYVALDGQIYALGGANLKSCERYSPRLDHWEAIGDLHYARYWASAVTYKGRIFIAGGRGTDHTVLASVEVFTPESNTWLLVSSMASPRSAFSLVSYGNRLWAIGNYPAEQYWESYCPETDSWRQEGNLPPSKPYHSSVIAFNGQLIIAGGAGDPYGRNALARVQKYDSTYGWTEGAPLSQGRFEFNLFVVPNIYPWFRA